MKLNDITSKRFGKLIVLHRMPSINGQTQWQCRCDCGKEKRIQAVHLKTGHTRSCGCSWYKFGKSRISWKGHGEIPMAFFKRILNGAKKRNISFNINIENIWRLFLKQKRTCALSGIHLDFTHGRNHHHKGTASLDRIDSSKGYIVGNIQWVHKDVNWMKQDYSNEYFLKMCSKITGHCNIKT